MMETFYDVLGVSADATADEIEAAYRDAIKQVHPDVSDDTDASERTAKLNKAKDVLTDESERARYDRLGHEAYTNGGPGQGSAGGDYSTAASRSDTSRSTADGRTDATGTATGDARSEADWSVGFGGEDGDGDEDEDGDGGEDDQATRGDGWDASAEASTGSTAAQRQAAASAAGGDATGSWNAWDSTRSWAVHQESGASNSLQFSRLFPPEQSMVLLVSTFLLYPFFVFSVSLPVFPLPVRLIVGLCTLLLIVYLASLPELGILVFGSWAVVGPLAILLWPTVGLFSVVGIVTVFASWIPLGFSVLTFVVVRPY